MNHHVLVPGEPLRFVEAYAPGHPTRFAPPLPPPSFRVRLGPRFVPMSDPIVAYPMRLSMPSIGWRGTVGVAKGDEARLFEAMRAAEGVILFVAWLKRCADAGKARAAAR